MLRFTSEAFAFLLRRIKDPSEIVDVMMEDIGDNTEYQDAITNIFVESMKAPGRTLHSKALLLFKALLEYAETTGIILMSLC